MDEQKSGAATLALVQLRAEWEFSASEVGDLARGQFRDDSAPLADSALGVSESAGSDGGPRVLGIEILEYVFFEHASSYSMLKTDSIHAEGHVAYAARMQQTMGDRIKLLRQAKGLSQSQLADRVGVTGGAISQWENGATKNIKLQTFLALCEELGTTPHYLIFGPERQPLQSRRKAP